MELWFSCVNLVMELRFSCVNLVMELWFREKNVLLRTVRRVLSRHLIKLNVDREGVVVERGG